MGGGLVGVGIVGGGLVGGGLVGGGFVGGGFVGGGLVGGASIISCAQAGGSGEKKMIGINNCELSHPLETIIYSYISQIVQD